MEERRRVDVGRLSECGAAQGEFIDKVVDTL